MFTMNEYNEHMAWVEKQNQLMIEKNHIENAKNSNGDSVIESSRISSPAANSPTQKRHTNLTQCSSVDSADTESTNDLPKRTKRNDESSGSSSTLGESLCDSMETDIKETVSKCFAQMKENIEDKDDQILQLQNELKKVSAEKKNLENQILDLQSKSKNKICIGCEQDMNLPNFCSNACLQ